MKESLVERFYFLYSFAFLILRTIAVSLFASNVHTESKKPAEVLNSLPNYTFNIEVSNKFRRTILNLKNSYLLNKYLFIEDMYAFE